MAISRPLKVRVNRAGATVRSRGGYYASAEVPGEAPEDRRAAFLRAARNPLDATALRLVVALDAAQGDAARLAVTTSVEASDLMLRQENGRWVGEFDIGYVQRASAGAGRSMVDVAVTLNMTPAEYAAALERGVVVRQELSASDSADDLRVVVRDAVSGAAGSVPVPRRR